MPSIRWVISISDSPFIQKKGGKGMGKEWDPTEIKIELPDPEFEAGIKEFELTLDEECTELDIDI